MPFSSFPSIPQFRETVKHFSRISRNAMCPSEMCSSGSPLDKQNSETLNKSDNEKVPCIHNFTGTVKLHGTNAGIGVTEDGEIWTQSHYKEITPENDNLGFSQYVFSHKQEFLDLICDLSQLEFVRNHVGEGIRIKQETCIFGEWCGRGIQKGVAISNVDRMFVVFAAKVAGVWLSNELVSSINPFDTGDPFLRVFNVFQFQTWHTTIDFDNLSDTQERLASLTQAVDTQCPVGSYFGVDGVGEGIVWTLDNIESGRLAFKVKGSKHSGCKNRTVKVPITPEKIKSISAFTQYSVTAERFNQCIFEVLSSHKIDNDNSNVVSDNKHLFVKWMLNDIVKEESDVLTINSLCLNDVRASISNKVRTWVYNYVKSIKTQCETQYESQCKPNETQYETQCKPNETQYETQCKPNETQCEPNETQCEPNDIEDNESGNTSSFFRVKLLYGFMLIMIFMRTLSYLY
jgi:hypothetical protein